MGNLVQSQRQPSQDLPNSVPRLKMGAKTTASSLTSNNTGCKKRTTRLSQNELKLVKATFKDLSHRSSGTAIDRKTFLTYFPVPGLHGEQLFEIFDQNGTGHIDYEDFIAGIALCVKGDQRQKLDLLFRIWDIKKDGRISAEELTTMLHQVPREALKFWYHNHDEKLGVNIRAQYHQSLNKTDPNESIVEVETKENILSTEDSHPEDGGIIDNIVDSAFISFGLERKAELSPEQFKSWICCDPSNVHLLESVFKSCKDPSLNPPAVRNGRGYSSHAKRGVASKKLRSFASSAPGSSRNINPHSYVAKGKHSLSFESPSVDILSPSHHSTSKTWQRPLKEGYLLKKGMRYKFLQSRYYRLFSNVLYYYGKEKSSIPYGVIMLTGCFVERTQLQPFSSEEQLYGIRIIVSTGGTRKERILYSRDEAERDNWLLHLKKASQLRDFAADYQMKDKIGTGKFSNVYLGISKSSGEKRAVKVIEKKNLSDEDKEFLRTEVAILRIVHHSSIVKLIDVYETRNRTYIVMELLDGGELYEYISGRKRFDEMESFILLRQLVSAVKYLHDAGIVHRDLKPENLLLKSKVPNRADFRTLFQIKLSDFGLSKLVAPDQILTLPCGTISYVAPEILNEEGYSKEADMWSIGVILYLVVRGRLPFDSEERDEIMRSIVEDEIDWQGDKFWSTASTPIVEILKGLLCKDRSKRLSATQILEHPWFVEMTNKVDIS